jgi:hypothetical protein
MLAKLEIFANALRKDGDWAVKSAANSNNYNTCQNYAR